jgi:serine/threonine protein kinase
MATGHGCLDDDDRRALLAGTLAESDRHRLEAHAEGCATCRSQLTVGAAETASDAGSLGSLLAAMVATPGEPAEVIAPAEVIDGQYRIVRPLGRGGMGVVYLARDQRLDRDVALKLGNVLSPSALARVEREAIGLAQLQHPNVVVVHGVGETDGRLYIAMEYVAGGNAREWRDAQPRSWREIVALYASAGDGLVAAHAAGLVHRDFKPDNVLVGGDGRPRVADFGLVRRDGAPSEEGAPVPISASLTPMTQTGTVVGTPAYMAPEQIDGDAVDARADQFAFCVSLWEALFEARPFPGRTPAEVAAAIASREPRRPDTKPARSVPRHVIDALRRGLAHDRAARWPSMKPLLATLRRDPSSRRRTLAIVAATAAVGAAIVAAAIVLSSSGGADKTATQEADRPPLGHYVSRQLTKEDPLHAQDPGAISPDGKTLAIGSNAHLLLRDIDSGSARELPSLPGRVMWLTWYPDGKRLLAAVAADPDRTDVLSIPLDGGAPTSLGLDVYGAMVSPDGKRIATFDAGGLRVANVDGSNPQLLVGTKEDAELGWPTWSPDGRWIAYALRGSDRKPSLRAVASDGSTDVLLVADPAVADPTSFPTYLWLADGRVWYVVHHGEGSSVLAIDVDPATGRARGTATTVAEVPDDFGLENPSGDGRRILASRSYTTRTRYQLALGARAGASPAVAPHDDWDLLGRSADSNVRFYSRRAGTDHTELVAVDGAGPARVLTSRTGTVLRPRLSPDRASMLWLEADADRGQVALCRMPTVGGAVQSEVLPYRPASPARDTRKLVVDLACPRSGSSCVLGAVEGSQLVFYAIDADGHRGLRLGSVPGAPPWTWDVTADGRAIVVGRHEGDLEVIDLAPWKVRAQWKVPDVMVDSVAWIDQRSIVLGAEGVGIWLLLRADVGAAPTTLWTSQSDAVLEPRMMDDGATVYFRSGRWHRTFWLLQQQ